MSLSLITEQTRLYMKKTPQNQRQLFTNISIAINHFTIKQRIVFIHSSKFHPMLSQSSVCGGGLCFCSRGFNRRVTANNLCKSAIALKADRTYRQTTNRDRASAQP